MNRAVIDVSELPSFAFHHRNIVWWGTMGMIVIEGMMFALLITAYMFLRGRSPHWPPGHFPPALLWGTVNTLILIASAVPNHLTKRAAEHLQLRKVRLWLSVALALGAAFNIVRIFEFQSLNVWFDENAYGSIVWTLLGFHTAHIVTDFVDSCVLLALLFIGPIEESHFVDAAENSMYWYFVVISWLPIYAVIYLAPRVA
jgi:heme/copper-type cytochrome/quinol oxidase subunit 3